MKIIHKYRVSEQVSMHLGARILHIAEQGGEGMFWVLEEKDLSMEERRFEIVGTGWEHDTLDYNNYVGTFIQEPFVWHVFEVRG